MMSKDLWFLIDLVENASLLINEEVGVKAKVGGEKEEL